MTRRVLIVDDDRQFGGLLRELLADSGDFDVVGEAYEGGAGVEEARRLTPDLVLLDVNLPDALGFELVPQLPDSAEVVLISSRDDEEYVEMAGAAGARGFLSKHELSPPALQALLDRAG